MQQETLTEIIARSFADDEDKALFNDLRERGFLTEVPEMWMVESANGPRFSYLWEREKSFWLGGGERHYSLDQAVERGLAVMFYQNHDRTCCQSDADYWCRQVARPAWVLNKLREERGRWGWEWDDPERRKAAQENDTAYHNSRYAPVTGVMKGQIWRIRLYPGGVYDTGNEVYALVTSLMGGCARLYGYYTVLHSPTYYDRPRDEVRVWHWGEYRYDQRQIDLAFGPGKGAELVEA